MLLLVVGLVLFLATHSVRIFAEPWRTRQRQRLGEGTWKVLLSLASLATFALMVWGYGIARQSPVVIWSPPPWTHHVAALLTLIAFVLLVAAFVPGTRIKAAVGHPMVAGVKTWALAHLLANGTLHDIVLFGGFLAWAVLSFTNARRRDRAAGTRYPAQGAARDVMAVAIAVVAWALFVRYGHLWLIGVRPLG